MLPARALRSVCIGTYLSIFLGDNVIGTVYMALSRGPECLPLRGVRRRQGASGKSILFRSIYRISIHQSGDVTYIIIYKGLLRCVCCRRYSVID